MSSTFPNELDIIPSFLDVNEEDIPLINQFEEYLRKNDLISANTILKQIDNVDRKMISAERLNKLVDCIVKIEEFYNSEIYPYLNTLQHQWENIVNQFELIGLYSPSVAYKINNMVLYSNQGDLNIYIRTDGEGLVNKNPLDTNYWRQLTVKGERGISSTAETVFCFDWSPSQTYAINSIVIVDNQWWIAVNQNRNSVPIEGNADWSLVMTSMQTIYPLTSDMPTAQKEGELWFQKL